MGKFKISAIIIAMYLLLSHSAIAQTVAVNQTFVENIDVTGDKIKEIVSINLKAESWNHPIIWTLKIVSNGSTTYEKDIQNPGGTWVVAKEELTKKFKLTEQEAHETVEWIMNRFKSGPVPILDVKISPVLTSFPKMYVEYVNDFVVIYKW